MGHDTFYQKQFEQLNGNENINTEIERLRLQKEILRMQIELQNRENRHYHGHEQTRHNEKLPTSIMPEIIGGSKYHNGKIGSDYYKRLKRISYTSNLKNGLQKNENGAYIKLYFGSRIAKVKVNYSGNHINFEYRGYNHSVLISERNYNEPLIIIFGDRMSERQRQGKKYGNFLEFTIVLDWR